MDYNYDSDDPPSLPVRFTFLCKFSQDNPRWCSIGSNLKGDHGNSRMVVHRNENLDNLTSQC